MPDPGLIYRTVEQHRRELLRMERQAASAMVREYGQSWQNIRKSLDTLMGMIAEMRRAGEEVPPSWLFQRDRLTILQSHVEAEIARFVDYAEPAIRQQQQAAVEAAEHHSQQAIATAIEQTGMVATFARLNPGAVEDLIGFSESGPLRDLFEGMGPEISKGFRRELVDGLLLGRNPREITRRVRRQYATGLARTLLISRTETLRSYREATRRNYQANSDIVEGWRWMAAKQARTCAMCLAMDGSFHTLDERLNDHPSGRCAMAPAVRGMPPIERETGAEWFEKQDEEIQRKVLGHAGYEAYKAGAVSLSDFVGQRHSREWGITRYARSLKQILGVEKARKWKDAALLLGRINDKVKSIAVQIKTLESREVLKIGEIGANIRDRFGNIVTNDIVLIGERRHHYLNSHPEMEKYEDQLVSVILNPDEVHRNRKDIQMAIFYQRLSEEHYLRVALWLSDDETKKNSIHSYRKAKVREVIRAREAGRKIWQKEKAP